MSVPAAAGSLLSAAASSRLSSLLIAPQLLLLPLPSASSSMLALPLRLARLPQLAWRPGGGQLPIGSIAEQLLLPLPPQSLPLLPPLPERPARASSLAFSNEGGQGIVALACCSGAHVMMTSAVSGSSKKPASAGSMPPVLLNPPCAHAGAIMAWFRQSVTSCRGPTALLL